MKRLAKVFTCRCLIRKGKEGKRVTLLGDSIGALWGPSFYFAFFTFQSEFE